MIKFKKSFLFMMVMALLLVFLPAKQVHAAENAYINVGSASGEVGSEVSVTVTISSSVSIEATDVYLSYDDSVVQAISGYDNGGSGTIRWVDTSSGTSLSRTIKFKILKAGTTQLTVVGETKVAGLDGYMTVSSSHGSVTGEAPITYSTDNTLKSLEISPGVLSPAFSPSVTRYTTSVGEDCERLAVSASANDPKASVSVSGTRMDPGNNTTTITVTAENGDKKVYTIYTTKPVPQMEPTDAPEPESTQAGMEEKVVKVNEKDYKIAETFETHPLPSGYEQIEYDYDGVKVNAGSGVNTKLIIMYLESLDGTGKSGFYLYDSVNKTFSIYNEVAQPQITYCVLPITKDMELPSGYTQTDFTMADKQVQALVDADRTCALFYGVSSTGKTGWYRYQLSDGTIQEYTFAKAEVEAVNPDPLPDNNKGEASQKNFAIYVLAGLFGIVSVVLAIVCAMLSVRLKKSRKALGIALNGFEDGEDDLESYIEEGEEIEAGVEENETETDKPQTNETEEITLEEIDTKN